MPKDFSNAAAAPTHERVASEAPARKTSRDSDFDLFKSQAETFFATPPSDPRHERMAARSGFAVSDASAEGATVIQAAYGVRQTPLAGPARTTALDGSPEWRSDAETGAALVYRRGRDGVVSAFLYPARSQSFGPDEDGVLLGRYKKLEVLTGRGVLESHWLFLRAYAEVSSLEGEPNWLDSARVAWLRFSRRAFREGRMRPARAWGFAEDLAGFSVAVAAAVAIVSAAL